MTGPHLLRLRVGPKGLSYRIVCPYPDPFPTLEDRPLCRPADLLAPVPGVCLVTMHVAANGLEKSWVGAPYDVTMQDTPLIVTWGDDGQARIAPCLLPGGPAPTLEQVAERLAAASGFARWRPEHAWKLLLEQRADVELAYSKSLERASSSQHDALIAWRDELLAWHDERDRQHTV